MVSGSSASSSAFLMMVDVNNDFNVMNVLDTDTVNSIDPGCSGTGTSNNDNKIRTNVNHNLEKEIDAQSFHSLGDGRIKLGIKIINKY